MASDEDIQLSKFLSLVLRHKPETIGLTLDSEGWTPMAELIACAAAHGRPMTADQIVHVVATSDKQRFRLSDDGSRIRASQGHSVAVDLGIAATMPPAELYHGTADRNLESILRSGLDAGERRHVHLSCDVATARNVGRRHGRSVVLRVDSAAMAAAGHLFYRADNGVWLTDRVPRSFLATLTCSSDGKEEPA